MQKHSNPGYNYKSIFLKRNLISDVEGEDNTLPEEFKIYQNYPNPFNPSTTIRFFLPQEARVSIKVYNIIGKEITELLNETRKTGEYEITWDGTDSNGKLVPSGIYFITMNADRFSNTIKAMLIK
jgi:hypothetical protein